MDTSKLMAISPLEGRYHQKVEGLRAIFSEYGLIKFRVQVEIAWVILLAEVAQLPEIPTLSAHDKKILENIAHQFSIQDAARIKHIEAGIKHDVKAVEYFIKEKIAAHPTLSKLCEFIHFGCTSEDINNLSYGLMLKTARQQCLLPQLDELISQLKHLAHENASIAMLARTHGQPASPTTVGKEIANVIARLERQVTQLINLDLLGKMNGASGNYNALAIAYPEIKWEELSKLFVTQLGLVFNPYTTQIEPHDYLAEYFAVLIRINNILIDFNRDVWSYISINYFKQKTVANEVGSSTMPHKVNPIDFENSEGNLGIANALLDHMMHKLPISRWQRDLTDSTVLRNIGVAIGHAVLAYQATITGILKLEANHAYINSELNKHWEILAEAIQTIMRRYQLPEPYEQLKAFTRGKEITQTSLREFIAGLSLPDHVKKEISQLSPDQYVGYAKELAQRI